MEKGVFVLSLDAELAWGCCFNKQKIERNNRHYLQTRENITALLGLMEKYSISATWCTVGHLFLSACAPVNGVVHPEIIRPEYSWLDEAWLAGDPCSNINADPIWYGADIVKSILNCRSPQEIACHTFSHVIVNDPGCSRECFKSELQACRELAEEINVPLKSFSYPRNKEKYIDTLADNGFTSYRGMETQWYYRWPKPVQKLAYFIDNVLFFIPPPVNIPVKEQCWNIKGSWFYGHSDGAAKLLPVACRALKIKNGLRRAAGEKAVFHLWFHPFNLAGNSRALLDGLDVIFREVHRLRKKGELDNLTMSGLAERLDGKV